MVPAYHFSVSPSAKPNTFANKTACTVRLHWHPPTTLSMIHPISFVHFERTDQRILGRSCGESVETKEGKRPKKTKTLLQQCMSRRSEVRCNAELARGPGIRATETEGGAETEAEAAAVPKFDISRLEAYTERVRSEVLCVNALLEDEEEEDQLILFKGFSSSLTRATPDDLSEPALPPTAAILSIDRLRAPYSPSKPRYIQQGISWREFQPLLEEKGL